MTIGGQSIATLNYDNGGRRTTTALGNGLTETRTWDNNLLTGIAVAPPSGPAVMSLGYAYDANLRKTDETDNTVTANSQHFGYDSMDRLTSWSRGTSAQSWTLSPVGDWSQNTLNGVVENRTHSPVHEIATSNGTPLSYDAAGNFTRNETGQGFAWDEENRLLAADTLPNPDGAADKAQYAYDAFGRRVSKTVFGTTTLYVYDGQQVVQELDAPTKLPASAAADDGSLANLAVTPAGAILPTTYDAQGHPQYPTRINYQPATTTIPQGFIADKSKSFAARSNGLSYGWVSGQGAPTRDGPVIRNFMPLPQYDTFVPLGEFPTSGNAGWTWQFALPQGSYPVVLVLGDATDLHHNFTVTVQGETFPDNYDPNTTPGYDQGRFVGVSKQVTVGANGLLTITAASGSLKPVLNFIEVGAQGTQLTDAIKQKLADEVAHASARTGGTPFWNGGKTETRTYVWGSGIDELVAYQRTSAAAGTQTYYVHNNAQWSVQAVTDSNGNVVERYSYSATGKRVVDHGDSYGRSIIGLTTGWTGRAHDDETGTIYFRNRIYHPDYQFLSRDPIGYVNGVSLYRAYFVPNKVDPSGLVIFDHISPGGGHESFFEQSEEERKKFYKNINDFWLDDIKKASLKYCVPWRVVYTIILNEYADYTVTESFMEDKGFGSSVGPGQVTVATATRIGLKQPDGSAATRAYLETKMGNFEAVAMNLKYNLDQIGAGKASAAFNDFAGSNLADLMCQKLDCKSMYDYNGKYLKSLIKGGAALHNSDKAISAKDEIRDRSDNGGNFPDAYSMGVFGLTIGLELGYTGQK